MLRFNQSSQLDDSVSAFSGFSRRDLVVTRPFKTYVCKKTSRVITKKKKRKKEKSSDSSKGKEGKKLSIVFTQKVCVKEGYRLID